MRIDKIHSGADALHAVAAEDDDPVRRLVEWLPRPIRFLGVGSLGLLTDLVVFSTIMVALERPLMVRLVSLAAATLVTWRLNRALTFDRTGRRQGEEMLRYAGVTVMAQGISYLVFAVLVLSAFATLPQAALLAGAAIAAAFSYLGHRLFAFAPHRPASVTPQPEPQE